jgi:hypothetical protein
MSKAIAEIAIGAGLIALDLATFGLTTPISIALLTAGSSLVMGGVGTLLTKQMQGLSANVRNPIQPWNVIYGQARVGGTVVFLLETGESDKYLHTVYVLACHPCQSVDAILFDDKRVPLDTSGNSISFGDSTSIIGSQQTVNISSITRVGDVVKVVMASAMPIYASSAAGPALATGDTVQIQNVTTDPTLNGQYQIQLQNSTTFTYISGGTAVSITGQGQVKTTWPDYGDTVHAEIALGTQSSNPFLGLSASGPTGSNGLWTSAHVLQGRTAVYLRLKYGGDTYASGMPNISFVVSGKNDIYDPRTGSRGYTTNSALIISDYLTQPVWGFKANYSTDVPYPPLSAAANICDESVTLASGGTEPRYTCNGSIMLSAKRGEILQNLLTSCGGRLTYAGGQFIINPAAWIGPGYWLGSTPAVVSMNPLDNAAGPFQWKPKVATRDLYNGVKATYICPANNWQSSDMPPYAQDVLHGYTSDANLAADGGERRWLDIQLPFTSSTSMAQRLAKIELLRRRQQGTGTFTFSLAMYQLTALDILSVTLPFMGWSGKLLEVTSHRFTVTKQEGEGGNAGMVLGTEIDVQETGSFIYDWSTSDELSAQGYAQPSVGPSTVAAPTGATATSGSGVASSSGGIQQSRVQISWSAPTDGYVTNGGYTVVQYQITGSSTWTALGNVDPSTTAAYIPGASDGTSYTPRVAFVSAQGIQSPWTTLSPVVASGGSLNLRLIYNETPGGTIDGTNVTFTLANPPSPANSLKLFLNQGQLVYGVDYTVSTSTITLVNAIPNTGDTIIADYRY